MPETDEILAGVQESIAEVLDMSREEVEPSMSFLADLAGGDSLELLDLQFHLNKRYSVQIAGIGSFAGAETDAEGRFTPAGLQSLRSSIPASLLDRFRNKPAPTARELLDAMTVADIANMVRLSLAAKNGKDAKHADSLTNRS